MSLVSNAQAIAEFDEDKAQEDVDAGCQLKCVWCGDEFWPLEQVGPLCDMCSHNAASDLAKGLTEAMKLLGSADRKYCVVPWAQVCDSLEEAKTKVQVLSWVDNTPYVIVAGKVETT